MRRRASVLSPMARIAAADGPTNTRPAPTTASANGARSDKKPYPGGTAWHPVSWAAATNFATSREDSGAGAGPSSTARSAARTAGEGREVAGRRAWTRPRRSRHPHERTHLPRDPRARLGRPLEGHAHAHWALLAEGGEPGISLGAATELQVERESRAERAIGPPRGERHHEEVGPQAAGEAHVPGGIGVGGTGGEQHPPGGARPQQVLAELLEHGRDAQVL